MILAYYRLGKYEDARRSMRRLLKLADTFRMDNPLTRCGSDVYQPNQPINLTYDAFGPPAAFVRGLFEYLYRADGLTILPHVPPEIDELDQSFPIRFGTKRVYLATRGRGPVTGVRLNGKAWPKHDKHGVFLPYSATPDEALVLILMGGANPEPVHKTVLPASDAQHAGPAIGENDDLAVMRRECEQALRALERQGRGRSYEAAHARLAMRCVDVARQRRILAAEGRVTKLAPPSEDAAQKAYVETAHRLWSGLQSVIERK
jgi:hypothetical protein